MKLTQRLALLVCALPLAANAVVFTNDATIIADDFTYDGADIIVSNATLTVDGPHTFANLTVGSNGVVTHTFSNNGLIQTNTFVQDEPQILVGTNEVALASQNITAATVSVKDNSGTITYQTNADFNVRTSGSDTFLSRSETSTIPDGAMVLVTYGIPGGTISAGLFLTVTGNVEVAAGGFINANGRGFGGNLGAGNGGETGSTLTGAGAGHGGYGGLSSSNAPGGGSYGAFEQPLTLGSGGGQGVGGVGGPGGGIVRLIVSGDTLVDGNISANALNATNSRSGGGSGGSIWITTDRFGGAGSITAHGGNGEPIHGGGGGGGRIAVYCDTNNFTGTFGAYGGLGWRNGGAGTVLRMITFTNGWFLADNNGRTGTNTLVNVGNNHDVTIRSNASVVSINPWFARHMTIASNSTLAPLGLVTPLNITAQTLTVEPTASLLADGAGSSPAQGGSIAGIYSGGSHGGAGGNSLTNTGVGSLPFGTGTTPSQITPSSYGSGGGGTNTTGNGGGSGGGFIRLNITGQLHIGGRVSANGRDGTSAGGGGGGSIWITTPTLTGAGTISANGGSGFVNSGGGGGGRVAIYVTTTNQFTGTITAYGGSGGNRGGAGTIYLDIFGPAGPLVRDFILDNGGFAAPNARSTTTIGSFSTTTPNLIVRNGAAGQTSTTMTFPNITVLSNSTLALSGNLTVTSNALVQAGGSIQTDGLGLNISANGSSTFISSGIYYGGGGANAGYGGNGGTNNARGGAAPTFGSMTSPTTAGGQGGGSGSSFAPFGGVGGGALRITVNGSLTNNGRISSEGKSGFGNYAGGGAGGSVMMTLGNFYGNGAVSANGGAGVLPGGGGGGGGRVSITLSSNFFTGPITAYGGNGANYGGAGTVYLRTNSSPNGMLTVDNGGNVATNTLLDFSSYGGSMVVSGGATPLLPLGSSALGNVIIKTNSFLVPVASSSQITLSVGSLTIEEGGTFSFDGRGNSPGSGIGSGSSSSIPRGGAGHGGYGALNLTGFSGNAYDSMTSPNQAGSGGGNGSGSSFSPLGGAGGGAVRLQFTGNNPVLTVNGRLTANGLGGELNSGGGSGGSLQLSPGILAGNGIISANGGAGNGTAGGGGGGRIAITYNTNLFTGQITANGGAGAVAGGAGTIYTKANSQSFGSVLIDNGSLSGTNTPLSSSFGLPTSPFNLTLSGGASVFALTPLPQLSNLVINAASTLTMRPNETNVSLNVVRDVTIAAGGAINVDGKGFGRGLGTSPGVTLASKGAGGGYGGAGGNSQSGALGGTNYGSATKPELRGSGGGAGANAYSVGCEGGGAVQMIVGGTLSVDGSVSANGNPGLQDDSGGGAGGSIWISAGALTGAGSFSATGGDGDLFGGGGGGGGRIAIYSPTNTFAGGFNVAGGFGANSGGDGSLFISTNLFTYLISGTVTNLSGDPQPGVLIQPLGFAATVTDTNGNYELALPASWSGTVTPSSGTNVFIPSTRSYNSLNSDFANRNYLTVPSVTPILSSGLIGTNLVFEWNGVQGVTYSAFWSTNLINWSLLGGTFTGSNGVMQLLVPANDVPYKFVRVQAFH